MDDLTLIGDPCKLEEALLFFGNLSKEIGLSLNAKKCSCIFQRTCKNFVYNGVDVPSIDFTNQAVKLLGSYIGASTSVQQMLTSQMTCFQNELSTVSGFNIPKQLKFAFLRLCYSSKFNHIFRSCTPSNSLVFCQKYNNQRTKFIANLINVDPDQIPSHAFASFNFGRIGLTRASILTRSAFLGGIRNFLYEFDLRFPGEAVATSLSPTLKEAARIVESLGQSTWNNLFPKDVDVPEKEFLNLKLSVRKLQNKLKVLLESETFIEKLSSAKEKNVKLYNLLIENSSTTSTSSSSFLLSIIPKKYGFNLSDDDFITCLRLRLNLDPGILLSQSLCLCGKSASFDHVVCCSHFNWCQSILYDNMIKDLHSSCKSLGILSNSEPLLNLLVNSKNKWNSKSCGDLHMESCDSKDLIVDATTVYFKSQDNTKNLCENAESLLKRSEDAKGKKYASTVSTLNEGRQRKLVFLPLTISSNGRLGSSAEIFFKQFEDLVRARGRKFYSVHFLKVRFVFAMFKKMSLFIRRIGLKLADGSLGLEKVYV
ncbi:hypothetical protein RCL1_000199 [Eukaryota sp. TZLM3-RCL]